MKVLIVEDEYITRHMMEQMFITEDYEVIAVENGKSALHEIHFKRPDIVLLDIGLPDVNGFDICRRIREHPEKYADPFILIVTCNSNNDDTVKGLEIGADDYIKKPFETKELIARIRAVTRRSKRESNVFMSYKNLRIYEDFAAVECSGEEKRIELHKRELDLLTYLIRNKGIILNRDNISRNVWNREYIEGDRHIDVYITRIKSKIPDIADSIKMIRGIGYKLEK